jgi:UDP-N-acetylglucosamine diphosphorylase / glucose-1-phosphate thymidylyltransferase / UDP-N-acetylgalactosamine diphosphorylase / glucosamine-1-phosphate N-acetyltransferase / galactosamine-1-phosphate N-acetyltransferase
MKIVVPMAGRGSRFVEKGVQTPKPFIQVAGQPMIYWAIKSLIEIPHSEIIFIALREHERDYEISKLLKKITYSSPNLILLDGITEGQLCTVLAARDRIYTEEDVLIASADTYIVSNLSRDIAQKTFDCHGIISVADMSGDQWSFARTDKFGRVIEVTEKVRISDYASTGLYYFSNGCELMSLADEIIANGEKTRGEYYIIPVYQKYIQRGMRVDISRANQMWDMGTPDALTSFEKHLAESYSKFPKMK